MMASVTRLDPNATLAAPKYHCTPFRKLNGSVRLAEAADARTASGLSEKPGGRDDFGCDVAIVEEADDDDEEDELLEKLDLETLL